MKVLEDPSAVDVALALLDEMASGVALPEALALALALAREAVTAAEDLKVAAEAVKLEATAAAFIDEEEAIVTEAATMKPQLKESKKTQEPEQRSKKTRSSQPESQKQAPRLSN